MEIISGSSGFPSVALDDSVAKEGGAVVGASPAKRVSTHVSALDGLRGFAVLAVMASHLFRGNYDSGGLIARTVGHTFEFGAKGVDLFFVLSGFLITGILYDSLEDSGYFLKFYARRCLRIFPLYYGVLFVLLLLSPVLGIEWHKMQWSLLFYLQNTNLIAPIWTFHLPHGLDLVHFWSLAVEEQFYLVWPLAVFLIRDRKRLMVVCALVSFVSLLLRGYLILHGAPFPVINCSTLCRADSLLAGAALALAVRGPIKNTVIAYGKPVFWAACFGMGAMFGLSFALHRFSDLGSKFDSGFLVVQYTVMAIGCAGLLGWCLRPRSIAAVLFDNSLLRWFGRYSYGLYVLHILALGLMLRIFHGWLGHLTSNKGVITTASGLMVFGVSVLAAYASYHLYEKPVLRLKRFVEYDRPETIPVMAELETLRD